MKHLFLKSAALAAVAFLSACGGGGSPSGPDASVLALPEADAVKFAAAAVPEGTAVGTAARQGLRPTGRVDVWVTLDQDSLARTRALLAETTGLARKRTLSAGSTGEGRAEPAAIRTAMGAKRQAILSQQAEIASRLQALGGRELGRAMVTLNAIAVSIDASQLDAVKALPGVLRVRTVVHHELHLGETVPYVGGAAVQAAGFDGTGVKVAVLDSGIDYTHKNLGGAGTAAAYEAAWGTSPSDARNTTLDGLFPTAKVVAGYDFVGETWTPTSGVRTEDPDPIDFQGHGTHVADIIAGKSVDGTHKGMAPGASLVAVKVCSAVSSSCNGVALIKGMDYAMDPNGDGDLSDAVDVINLSLGSSYGQIEDDLTFAATNAVAAGTIVVASAGNSANLPYVMGSPSMGPGVLSVAQTAVPSDIAIPLVINAPASIAGVYGNTATLSFAPIGAGVSGTVKSALQAGGANNLACAALPAGSLTGKIAMIDRGTCSISVKVDFAAKAGATGVLIGLVAAGDAVTFSFGGGDTFVPSLVIQQSLGSAIKARLTAGDVVNVSISPAASIALVGSMASSSSRGPSVGLSGIKPEIGAPGASLSAQAGTGSGQTAFGGTSGAAPMVSGAAALMLQAHPARSAMQIKALLMNNAETTVYTNPATRPGELAPITRIGGGELRVNRALTATAAARDVSAQSAALSFGAIEVSKQTVLKRTLTVENFSASPKTYSVTPSYRFADDQAADAVRISAPATVSVPANGSATLEVQLLINPGSLPAWTLNGGNQGGNGNLLNLFEVDGYITLVDGAEKLTVPWHVLPRKAALTSALAFNAARNGNNVVLKNVGAEAGAFDLFSLVGTSAVGGFVPAPQPGDNYALVDLKAVGVRFVAGCGATGGCVQFAMATNGRRSHPVYPGGFEVDIDSNGDGRPDFYVFQAEQGSFGTTGQSAVRIQNAATGTVQIFFFTDADLNSSNVIYTVPLSALGATSATTLGFDVIAYDNYLSGNVSDAIQGMKFTPGSPRYTGSQTGQVAISSTARVPFTKAVAVTAAQSTETGLLMMYRRNDGSEADAITLP